MGFKFDETMSGTYALLDTPDDHRRLSFTARMQADSTLAHLKDGKMRLIGTLEMDGFADVVPIEGTLVMLPLTKKIIRYEFSFTGNDGRPYRFAGQKDIQFTSLRKSFTTLPASITDAEGREIATAMTRFDISADMYQFATSWRPT